MKIKTIYSRPRMDKLLSGTTDYPLTAVVAGAGYGKTTAAREYLKKANVPHAWITLTNGDEGVLWDKLCAVIRPLSEETADALCLLGMPVGAWPVSRAVKLIREHCTKPFILCVDDYQYLTEDSPVHTLAETIAFEDIPNFHLLLLSRAQPNLRLATLASKEMALCIDAETLGFTEKETDGYLAMRGLRLTKGVVDSICEISAGWVSAIYLLGEGIRTGGAVHKNSIDTLFTENLLRPLAEPDRDALYRLSVFEAFTPDLAADALGTQRIRDVLAGLLRENAFTTRDERPVRRNPLITSILYYSKDVESFGTGLKRIADACKDAECRYEFKILKSGFVVVFYRNEEIKDSKGETSTVQDAVQVAGQVTVQDLLAYCSIPRSRQEMQAFCQLAGRNSFSKVYLKPLLESGQLRMTIPEKPNSRNQKYVAAGKMEE